MHKHDFVVCLYTANDRSPLSEIKVEGTDRTAKVVLPFGSEYYFQVRNMKSVRRRFEIRIDGALVGDFVVGAGSRSIPVSATVERYANSARKFCFVRQEHSEVSDPKNPKNGQITVKVWEELPAPQPIVSEKSEWEWNPQPPWKSKSIPWHLNQVYGCSSNPIASSCLRGLSASRELFGTASASQGLERGATIEGSASSQQFDTTFWYGDVASSLTEFVFMLFGQSHSTATNKLSCIACDTELEATAKFCSNCGTKVGSPKPKKNKSKLKVKASR